MARPAQDYEGAHALAAIGTRRHIAQDAPLERQRRGKTRGERIMTSFADREKEFEARFKHDQELRFKTTARRNRLAGEWAARKLGLAGEAAEAYAKDLVNTQFKPGGDRQVADKLAADLAEADPSLTLARIRFELEHFASEAKRQLMQE
ncbi:MAG: DUF1476 domain-containing protein [Stellaceae bacterium]